MISLESRPRHHPPRLPVALLVLIGMVAPMIADDTPEEPAQSAAQRWYAVNADFTGVAATHTVTRRFEMYNPHSREQLEMLKDMGFTQVMLDWPNLHADATNLGLNVVLANWWIDTTDEAEIDRGVEQAMQVVRSRLAGIGIMDEPERNAPDTPLEFYEELYGQLRPRLDEFAPCARLEISHWGPSWNWSDELYEAFVPLYLSADVMRIMPYPDLYEGPLSDVFFMMARSRRLMRLAGRELPMLVILQTWTLTPESDLPTIDELRVMAYQAMLGGAETVSFFDDNPEIWQKTPGFREGFTELMHELTALSDLLANSCLVTTMSEQGILTTTAADPGGRTRTIRVNTNRHPTDGLEPLAVVVTPPTRLVARCRCHRTCCAPTSAAPGAFRACEMPSESVCRRRKITKRLLPSRLRRRCR